MPEIIYSLCLRRYINTIHLRLQTELATKTFIFCICYFVCRLSTIVNADRIICMDQGVIVEQGTHDELMKAKGKLQSIVMQ